MPNDRFRVEPLGTSHDRTAFSSGVGALDEYLRHYAHQDMQRRLAVVYVLEDVDGERIAGFYTLSSFTVDPRGLPDPLARRLPRRPVPVILLGRLATELNYRGQGLGGLLLIDALRRSLQGSQHITAMALVVNAKDDTAREFYEKYGFTRFSDDPFRLFIPMATIDALVNDETL